MRRSKLLTLCVGLACMATACASGSGVRTDAGDELREGYRAARRGYWQEALYRFERANELEPHRVKTLNNLAVALEAVGRFEDAGRVYEEARAIDSSDRKLQRNYKLYKEFYDSYLSEEAKSKDRTKPPEDEEGGEEKDNA